MIRDAHIYGPDSIMFDLEDSVSIREKDAARFLVYHALKEINYNGTETVVRVNGLDTPFGNEDFQAMVRAQPDIIRLPKTETREDIIRADKLVTEIEAEAGIQKGTVKIMAAIETALGVINAYEIASASDRLVAIAIGAEDFVTDIKTTRSPEGIELLNARSHIVLAARAAGIDALDTIYADINNEEGFVNEVKHIKQLGFDGKSVIHPRQIEPVHHIYTPTSNEIEEAIRTVEATQEAEEKGLGVISLDGKMIDGPIIDRARRIIDLAKQAGIVLQKAGENLG